MVNISFEQYGQMQSKVDSLANKKNPIIKAAVKLNKAKIGRPNLEKEQIKKHKYGAQKTDGYDSKLEAFMAGLLKMHKINFKEKEKFILQASFKYGKESIREIAMYPDFCVYDDNILKAIIDTKGMSTPDWKLKLKMLKCSFYEIEHFYEIPDIYIPHSQKECREVISKFI